MPGEGSTRAKQRVSQRLRVQLAAYLAATPTSPPGFTPLTPYCSVHKTHKTHYGLPQAGALSQQRLLKHLTHGYTQIPSSPSVFRHRSGFIRFTLGSWVWVLGLVLMKWSMLALSVQTTGKSSTTEFYQFLPYIIVNMDNETP
jgi:hypothetical protein